MDDTEKEFEIKEERRRRKKKNDIAYRELQKIRQKEDEKRQTNISERKKKEIEFRKEIDARGILSEDRTKKETEMSTIQYLSKADGKRAIRKIIGHPIIMFSTEKIFHCDRPVEKIQYLGTYYEKNKLKQKKSKKSKEHEER